MKINKVMITRLATMLFAAAFITGTAMIASGGENQDDPAFPAQCTSIEAPPGHAVSFHAYALGVQVYRWSGTRWDFVEPVANLFVDLNYTRKVGSHFAGPTWMSNGGGSSVAAATVERCTPDTGAIAWLLLKATSSEGSGFLGETTYIQRVRTSGGLAPITAGSTPGAEARVPYSAEYVFYRSAN